METQDSPIVIAGICERWAMPIMLETARPGHEKWFLDWVLAAPSKASTHITAGWHAYQSLLSVYGPEEVRSAHEFFGGMGAHSLIIRETFPNLASHTVLDFSEDAVRHLRRELEGRGVTVKKADSFAPSSIFPADVVGVDGVMTVWRTREGDDYRELLDRVFAQNPKAVVLTDIAARYLHLHRERYETLLGPGSCASYESYLDAFATRIQILYQYSLVAGFHDRWSTVMSFAPDGLATRGKFCPTPDSPVGLELM